MPEAKSPEFSDSVVSILFDFCINMFSFLANQALITYTIKFSSHVIHSTDSMVCGAPWMLHASIQRMGNQPHCSFFTENLESTKFRQSGSEFEIF